MRTSSILFFVVWFATLPLHLTAGDQPYTGVEAFPSLKFKFPLAIAALPKDKKRIFILEKGGRIQVLGQIDAAAPTKKVYLDISKPRDGKFENGGECGLLGLAFHPQYDRNGFFFIAYSLKIKGELHQRLARFKVSAADPDLADPSSEQPLISQRDDASNHNGGDLHFGPDGCLYYSVGDGGSGDDSLDNANHINKGFHAAILRLDVDKKPGSFAPNEHPAIHKDAKGQAFYAVPADNPFVTSKNFRGNKFAEEGPVRSEIWACGLRNVWRFSYDEASARWFAGDVGQNAREEIDILIKGGDYGWSFHEGKSPFTRGPGKKNTPKALKPVEPIFDYPRDQGQSVTGGIVYHGKKLPELKGAYIFADFASGKVFALREKGGQWKSDIIAQEESITGFGEDPRTGELLFTSFAGNGKVKVLVKDEAKK